MYYNVFIHRLLKDILVASRFLVIMIKATINIHVQVFNTFEKIFFKYILLIMLLHFSQFYPFVPPLPFTPQPCSIPPL